METNEVISVVIKVVGIGTIALFVVARLTTWWFFDRRKDDDNRGGS